MLAPTLSAPTVLGPLFWAEPLPELAGPKSNLADIGLATTQCLPLLTLPIMPTTVESILPNTALEGQRGQLFFFLRTDLSALPQRLHPRVLVHPKEQICLQQCSKLWTP